MAHSLYKLEQSVYNEANKDFDHANKCQASSGGNGNDKSRRKCCGSYPTRFKFSTEGDSRACCEDVTYNQFQQDCCYGSVQAFGTC